MYHEDWIEETHINDWAVFEHAKFFDKKPNKAWKILESLFLLKAISLVDFTTLGGDDSFSNVTALVNKGVRPLSANFLQKTLTKIVSLIEYHMKTNPQKTVTLKIEINQTGIKITDDKDAQIDKTEPSFEDLLEVKQLLSDFGFTGECVENELTQFLSLKNEITDCKNETRKTVRVASICVYPAFVHVVAESLKQKGLHMLARQTVLKNETNFYVLKKELKRKPINEDFEENLIFHGTNEDVNVQNDISDGMPIASVAAGFPSGLFCLESKIKEINYAISNGASEIDIVISRYLVIEHRWFELSNEIRALKEACGSAKMKTILAVGECGSLENIYKASMVAMMSGSDYIKTSTGKETINATFPAGIVMCRAIKNFYLKTGIRIGFKPAGGIRTAEDCLKWIKLIYVELGPEWLSLFRIGASGVMKSIEDRLKELNPL